MRLRLLLWVSGGYDMSLTERIIENVKTLPELKQREVLDFVEYLRSRAEKEEKIEWNALSLSSAMRGMEDEKSPYSMNDLKETFS
ncbi:MAG: hypothetical protein BROFUL_01321 [Candidatus Brocadia fulgida]|uniref:DUF2281 domain-containing protein n=1 Tax=Candidatus Brocadia fulgida TaxID=380242 RepID=A0A0M2UV89_9BACT|nr:MAG: hypothetical protein BROFUL_01321 [Candidatus Brocadia fulgida]